MTLSETAAHYDALVREGNDPVLDSAPLQEYMNRWDGAPFFESLALSMEDDVLEIGVGTGRLAVRTAPLCRSLCGIDISPASIERARENLSAYPSVNLILGDFMTYPFDSSFNVIYSSLTLMHIEDKLMAARRMAGLLRPSGRVVLSLDKNPSEVLVCGERRLRIYPDRPDDMAGCLRAARLRVKSIRETDFAWILSAAYS